MPPAQHSDRTQALTPFACRSAYQTETRSTILTLDKVCKTAPNGKELLKNVSLGMYRGAKIGILGANGSGACLRARTRHAFLAAAAH